MPPHAVTADSFWARVAIPADPSECWLWQGKPAATGYGQVAVHKQHWNAHRFSYTLWHGEEPAKGMHVDHLCRVPLCVNPAHLRVVTSRENTMAFGSLAPAKRNAEKTHCDRGHAFTPENTWVWTSPTKKTTHRHCRECGRARVRARRQRERVAA